MVATLEVAYVNQAAKVYVVEHGPSGDVLLAARDIYSGGSYPMMFVPSTGNITIDIVGPTDMGLYRLCFDKLVSEQQTVIVDVCDKVKDSYPYGYNGQEKVNEWAGPGNHNTAEFWEYDTRTARRLEIDPLFKQYPSQSPYSTFNGNPIFYNDPTGESGVATINKQTKTITVTSTIILYGTKASVSLAKDIASSIQTQWNAANGNIEIDGTLYNVKFNIKGKYIKEDNAIYSNVMFAIGMNKNQENNFIRVEDDNENGTSFTTFKGSNTGFWVLNQLGEGSTTPSHEYNHGLGGLDHPEKIDRMGGNQDKSPSIDMTELSYNYVKPEFRINDKEKGTIMDKTKRKVTQNNINAIFTKDKVEQLKKTGRVNIGTISNPQYYSK